MTITLQETLKQLEALGNEKMRAQNRKRGGGDEQFGVRLGDVRKLAARIKTNHELALALWETGNIDARLLAILLIRPKDLSGTELDWMVRSATGFSVPRAAASAERWAQHTGVAP
jgi:3-methyladenine DNA glycosylase AlkD